MNLKNLQLFNSNSKKDDFDSSDSFDEVDMMSEGDSDEEMKDERHSIASASNQQMKRMSMTQGMSERISTHSNSTSSSDARKDR